ncbi:uncharacterized protein BCN122_III0405 [Burkholderia cenocepacia]|nr:uncharacterized protein BCN122_III0405 [Burkholderia cenocepacia]
MTAGMRPPHSETTRTRDAVTRLPFRASADAPAMLKARPTCPLDVRA